MCDKSPRAFRIIKGYLIDISSWQTRTLTDKMIEQLQTDPKVFIRPQGATSKDEIDPMTHDRNVPDLNDIANYLECSTVVIDENLNTHGSRDNLEDSQDHLFIDLEEAITLIDNNVIDKSKQVEKELNKMFAGIEQEKTPSVELRTIKKRRRKKRRDEETITAQLRRLFGEPLDDIDVKISKKDITPKKIDSNRRHTLPVSISLPTEDFLNLKKISHKRKSETDICCSSASVPKINKVHNVVFATQSEITTPTEVTYCLIKEGIVYERVDSCSVHLPQELDTMRNVVVTTHQVHEAESQEVVLNDPIRIIPGIIDLTEDDVDVVLVDGKPSLKTAAKESVSSELANIPVKCLSMPLLSPATPAEATEQEATLPEKSKTSGEANSALPTFQNEISQRLPPHPSETTTTVVSQNQAPLTHSFFSNLQSLLSKTQQPTQEHRAVDVSQKTSTQERRTDEVPQPTSACDHGKEEQSAQEKVQGKPSAEERRTTEISKQPAVNRRTKEVSLESSLQQPQTSVQVPSERQDTSSKNPLDSLRRLLQVPQREAVRNSAAEPIPTYQQTYKQYVDSQVTVPQNNLARVTATAQVPQQSTQPPISGRLESTLASIRQTANQQVHSFPHYQSILPTAILSQQQPVMRQQQSQPNQQLPPPPALLRIPMEQQTMQKNSGQQICRPQEQQSHLQQQYSQNVPRIPPPSYESHQSQPTSLSSLHRMRVPEMTRIFPSNQTFQIISTNECSDKLLHIFYDYIDWMKALVCFNRSLESLMDCDFKGCESIFSHYVKQTNIVFGKKIIKALYPYDVSKFDSSYFWNVTAVKLTQRENISVGPYYVVAMLAGLVKPCERDCMTPFTKRFYKIIMVTHERLNERCRQVQTRSREAETQSQRQQKVIFNLDQLRLLGDQIRQCNLIGNWVRANLNNPMNSAQNPRPEPTKPKRPRIRDVSLRNTILKSSLNHNTSLQSPRNDDSNSTYRHNPNIVPPTDTSNRSSPSSSVPTVPDISTLLKSCRNNDNNKQMPSSLPSVVPPPSSIPASVNGTPIEGQSSSDTDTTGTEDRTVSQETSVIVYAESENKSLEDVEDSKPTVATATGTTEGPNDDDDVIDLTWIDDGDEAEMWEDIKDIKATANYFKLEVDEDSDASGRREIASPADSGLGSPRHEPDASYFKCLCGGRAIFICACNNSMYCSRDCQVQDWVDHQNLCGKIKNNQQ